MGLMCYFYKKLCRVEKNEIKLLDEMYNTYVLTKEMTDFKLTRN